VTDLKGLDLLEHDPAILLSRLESYRRITRELLAQLHLSLQERDRLKARLRERANGPALGTD
jgi:hypothetical protein